MEQKLDASFIRGVLKRKKEEAVPSGKYIQTVYHGMMIKYGFIPFNTFSDMSLFLTIDLLELMEEDYKAQKAETKRAKAEAKRRRGR